MARVHLTPWGWVLGGGAALAGTDLAAGLSPLGWAAGALWLLGSTTLLTIGLVRRRMRRFGPANAVTGTRSALVAVVTALTATSFTQPIPTALLVGVTVPALALDAVDGWMARRTGTASELGARFDMEVDAFLLLVLSVYVAPALGLWVLAIGGLRYAFVVAGWMLPWMRATLPFRYWRKVVTAYAGIALAVAASGLLPSLDSLLVGVALLLLVESFTRDTVWLIRRRRAPRPVLVAGREYGHGQSGDG